MKKIFL